MSTIYELWDRKTANQIGSYESQAEAMAIVRDVVREYGNEAIATVALGRESEDDDTVVIAAGRDLADLALQDEPLSTRP
jgi:hypothetical protein